MMNKYILSVICIAMIAFSSCKVDFSPNAEWKEVPVVWCVLDQGDDTTWVRVQKCYLGEDNLCSYAQVTDSINYPAGSICVVLEKWNATRDSKFTSILNPVGESPKESKVLDYMVRMDKDQSGIFVGGEQPIYYARTKDWLDTNYVYKLVVLNVSKGDTLAQAVTSLVGAKYGEKECITSLVQPNPTNPAYRMFRFAGNPAVCEIKWNALARGRLYQPVVRFYYYHQYLDNNNVYKTDSSHRYYTDIKAPSTKNTTNSMDLKVSLSESAFFSDLVNNLQSDKEKKGFCDTVDLFLTVCNEDLNAYIASTEATSSIVQERVTYTNIQGGVGIFASRLTHLRFTCPSNAETGPGSYHDKIKKLNIGFE